MEEMEEEEYVPWDVAKGYDECEEFMYWRTKSGKKDWKEEDWTDRRKEYEIDNEIKDDDTVDQYKYDGSNDSPKNGERGSYHGRHGSNRSKGGKRKNCGAKPKPLDQICAEIECAPAEKLDISGCGFEARRVFAAKWVVTPIDTSDMRRGYQDAFWRLFKYINGANEDGVRIDMTVPVINKWWYDDSAEVTGGQMAFYIPSVHQDAPPAPTNSEVTVEQWDEAVVYDRAFGGNRRDADYYKKQFVYLWQALAKVGINPFPGMSITAGYTRPGWGRQRNEVMYVDDGSM